MSEENNKYVNKAGSYLCVVKQPGNGWFGEAGEKQTPFIRIPCKVTEAGDQQGKEIVYTGWLSDAAFDRTIENLCKTFPQWNGDMDALHNRTFSFAGSECEIVAESETYNGETRIKAKWLNNAGGCGKEMDGAKVASLISKMGRKAKAIAKTVNGGTAAPAAKADGPANAAPEGQDDIPFN